VLHRRPYALFRQIGSAQATVARSAHRRPLFLSLVNALMVHHGNRLLLFVGMFAAIIAFFVLAIWSQCAQRSKRACTTGVWYDGIHYIAQEKTSFMPWANITGARVDGGDVFIDSVNVASGIYIGRSAFSALFPPDVLVECINRARHGDFSMIVPRRSRLTQRHSTLPSSQTYGHHHRARGKSRTRNSIFQIPHSKFPSGYTKAAIFD